MHTDVSRRLFVKGAALGAGAGVLGAAVRRRDALL